jgi:hypothetical protein
MTSEVIVNPIRYPLTVASRGGCWGVVLLDAEGSTVAAGLGFADAEDLARRANAHDALAYLAREVARQMACGGLACQERTRLARLAEAALAGEGGGE